MPPFGVRFFPRRALGTLWNPKPVLLQVGLAKAAGTAVALRITSEPVDGGVEGIDFGSSSRLGSEINLAINRPGVKWLLDSRLTHCPPPGSSPFLKEGLCCSLWCLRSLPPCVLVTAAKESSWLYLFQGTVTCAEP